MPRQAKAPADFGQEARQVWISCQRQLRRQGTWAEVDVALLEQLARNVVLARDARRQAEDTPFVAGSQGQLVAHPGLRVAEGAEAHALRLANALLLTPDARARHGISASQAPDDELAAIVG